MAKNAISEHPLSQLQSESQEIAKNFLLPDEKPLVCKEEPYIGRQRVILITPHRMIVIEYKHSRRKGYHNWDVSSIWLRDINWITASETAVEVYTDRGCFISLIDPHIIETYKTLVALVSRCRNRADDHRNDHL
jgi:hypothetical protein